MAISGTSPGQPLRPGDCFRAPPPRRSATSRGPLRRRRLHRRPRGSAPFSAALLLRAAGGPRQRLPVPLSFPAPQAGRPAAVWPGPAQPPRLTGPEASSQRGRDLPRRQPATAAARFSRTHRKWRHAAPSLPPRARFRKFLEWRRQLSRDGPRGRGEGGGRALSAGSARPLPAGGGAARGGGASDWGRGLWGGWGGGAGGFQRS